MKEQVVAAVVAALREKKAKNIRLFNLSGKSDICSYQLVCSGLTQRQTKALSEVVEDSVKAELKVSPIGFEGRSSGFWVVLDYNFLIVHIFLDEIRGFYAIEDIWADTEVEMEMSVG